MKTIKGIYYDLTESTYILKYDNLSLYFSSMFLEDKYIRLVDDYIKYESARLHQRYNIDNDIIVILYIALYRKIEKRGFYILYKNKVISLESIKLIAQIIEG